MSRVVYLNGDYIPETEAHISVFDRGFLFGDSMYEVTAVLDEKLLDYAGHLSRLERSLNEMNIPYTSSLVESLLPIHRELIRRNNLVNGVIYLQISRGVAPDRNFLHDDYEPTILAFTQSKDLVNNPIAERGLRIITLPDERWSRCDIKSTQLVAQSQAKMRAKAANVDDAWMVKDGFVTEGTSYSVFILKGDTIITRQLGNEILPGITRSSVLKCASELQLKVEERPFTVSETKEATEAFVTSAGTFITAVVEIDGAAIGDGKPGPVAKRLREIYIQFSKDNSI